MFAWIRAPPISWPKIAARPMARPYAVIAFVRARPAKAVPRIASTCGVRSAAARPCSTRAPIRVDTLGANPHAAEASGEQPEAEVEHPATAEHVARADPR